MWAARCSVAPTEAAWTGTRSAWATLLVAGPVGVPRVEPAPGPATVGPGGEVGPATATPLVSAAQPDARVVGRCGVSVPGEAAAGAAARPGKAADAGVAAAAVLAGAAAVVPAVVTGAPAVVADVVIGAPAVVPAIVTGAAAVRVAAVAAAVDVGAADAAAAAAAVDAGAAGACASVAAGTSGTAGAPGGAAAAAAPFCCAGASSAGARPVRIVASSVELSGNVMAAEATLVGLAMTGAALPALRPMNGCRCCRSAPY